MKIRNGFVTNSSSSSFILGFHNEDEIEFLKQKGSEDKHYFELYNDIITTKRWGKEDIVNGYMDDVYYDVRWDLQENLKREKHWSYEESWEFTKTTEFKKMLQDKLEKIGSAFREKCADRTIFVYVTYGDGGNGEDGVLEQHIVPHLDSCLAIINGH